MLNYNQMQANDKHCDLLEWVKPNLNKWDDGEFLSGRHCKYKGIQINGQGHKSVIEAMVILRHNDN